jgi:hypothetical protein
MTIAMDKYAWSKKSFKKGKWYVMQARAASFAGLLDDD